MIVGLLYPMVRHSLAVDLHIRTIFLVDGLEPHSEVVVLLYCESAVHGVFSISIIGIVPLKLSKFSFLAIIKFAFSILCAAFDIFFEFLFKRIIIIFIKNRTILPSKTKQIVINFYYPDDA